jgi:hypothetical protein
MGFIADLISKWEGWATITGILMLVLSFIVKRIREAIVKFFAEYILTYWRRLWYWISNRSFIVSGYIKFEFSRDISEDKNKRDSFDSNLRNDRSLTDFKGSIGIGEINARSSEMQFINLILKFTTAQDLKDEIPKESAGMADMEHGEEEEREGTRFVIKWEKIPVRYREISSILSFIRNKSEDIKDKFAPLVGNSMPDYRSAFFEVFYRKDCRFDPDFIENIKLPDDSVSMEKNINRVAFGAPKIDLIIPFLPKYLVKETLRSLLRRTN